MRLSIEELCVVLGQTKNVRLYEVIGNLVSDGKGQREAQKALDAVTVKGSSLLHPGQIDLADTFMIATNASCWRS
jgi:hypothetical protein